MMAAVCVALAVLLAVSAVSVCLDGSVRREQDPPAGIFTREIAAEKLHSVAPLFIAFGILPVIMRISGVKDDCREHPLKAHGSGPGTAGSHTVHIPADSGRKVFTVRVIFLILAVVLLVLGILNGSAPDVFSKAVTICTECIQLEDFVLTCYDGTEFHLAAQRGRITFISLWATWCTPCVNELPYFDQLFRDHGDEIAVIAVHSFLVTDDPVQYLSGRNFSFPFATDTENDTVQKAVGGSGTLPQTVVLNRKGEVVYNQIGSVTPEILEVLF